MSEVDDLATGWAGGCRQKKREKGKKEKDCKAGLDPTFSPVCNYVQTALKSLPGLQQHSHKHGQDES